MKELPSDILELIADISKREDVVRASSVCKAWRTSFAPYAFATLSFRNVDFRSRFEHPEALVSFDRIMPHVRELALGEFGSTGTVRAPLIAAINTNFDNGFESQPANNIGRYLPSRRVCRG
jgi:hypothetical protein